MLISPEHRAVKCSRLLWSGLKTSLMLSIGLGVVSVVVCLGNYM